MARRHRSYSLEFKRHVAQQYLSGDISLARLARQHDISRNLIRVWIAKYEAGEFDDEQVQGDLLARYVARIAELERKVGQLIMENDLLKKPAQGMACCQGAVRDPVRRPICADGLNVERRLNTQDFLQDPAGTFGYWASANAGTVTYAQCWSMALDRQSLTPRRLRRGCRGCLS